MQQRAGSGRGRGGSGRSLPTTFWDRRQAGGSPKVSSGLAFVTVTEQTLFYVTTRWLDLYLLNIWRHGIEASGTRARAPPVPGQART